MKQFHGAHKKHAFFEGWYVKHQKEAFTISFIPAFHRDDHGIPSMSIQIITPDYSGQVLFPAEQFLVNQTHFSLQVGKNHFSDTGIAVDLQSEDFYVRGSLSYDALTPPASDMMGPFRHIPFMQCNHGVLSLTHRLLGTLDVNGTIVDFSGGTGYIEKDWGSSFPQSYLWTQSNWNSPTGSPCCIMLSIAHIPLLTAHFTGCICSVYYEDVEYRLATYRHARILQYTPQRAVIDQGPLRLLTELSESVSHPLSAPARGDMSRTIYESVSSTVHYHLTKNGSTLFDVTLPHSCFETGGFDSVPKR